MNYLQSRRLNHRMADAPCWTQSSIPLNEVDTSYRFTWKFEMPVSTLLTAIYVAWVPWIAIVRD